MIAWSRLNLQWMMSCKRPRLENKEAVAHSTMFDFPNMCAIKAYHFQSGLCCSLCCICLEICMNRKRGSFSVETKHQRVKRCRSVTMWRVSKMTCSFRTDKGRNVGVTFLWHFCRYFRIKLLSYLHDLPDILKCQFKGSGWQLAYMVFILQCLAI